LAATRVQFGEAHYRQ